MPSIKTLRRLIKDTVGPGMRTATTMAVHGQSITVRVGGSARILRDIPVIGDARTLSVGEVVALREADGQLYAQVATGRVGESNSYTPGASGSAGASMTPHAMSYHTDETSWHTGLTTGSLHHPKVHTHLTDLEGGVLANYVRTDEVDEISVQHTFAPPVAQAPFDRGPNAWDQLVEGFNADQLDGYHAAEFAPLAGDAEIEGFWTFLNGLKIGGSAPLQFGDDVALLRKTVDVLALAPGDSFESWNYVSGTSGWHIGGEEGNAEFNSIVARGEFHTSVFVAGEQHATGGTMMVLTASTLYSDVITV